MARRVRESASAAPPCKESEVFITHSYAGTMVGTHQYLFFALYEDYNDVGRAFVREFDVHLERLARTLGHGSAVVRPFLGY